MEHKTENGVPIIGHVIDTSTNRVAMVHRKKNGKKLLYINTGQGVNFGSPELREYWQQNMKEVGAFGCGVGEIPSGMNAPGTQAPAAVVPTDSCEQDNLNDWQPSDACPEDGGGEDQEENTPVLADETPNKSGRLKKVVLGLSLAALAFAGWRVSANSQGGE